jgi:hypothetical protein
MNYGKPTAVKSLLATAIALSLVACGSEDTTLTNTGGTGGSNTETPMYNSHFIVFNDGENAFWEAFDSSGATTPSIVDVGDDYGSVMEFTPAESNDVDEDNAVFGFVRSESTNSLDASAYAGEGVLTFDLRLVNAPVADDVSWLVKFESNGGIYDEDTTQGEEAEITIETPELGVWQEVTINMPDLVNLGLDLAGIDKIIISPAWGKGEGIKFQVDNVKFVIDGYVPPVDSLIPTALPEGHALTDVGTKLNIAVTDTSDFGGAVSQTIEQNGETFVQTLKPATAETWAGTTVVDSDALAFENGRTKMSVWVYSPEASVPVVLKVENANDPSVNVLAQAHTSVAEEWEKLTFDFSMPLEGVLNMAATYDKKSLFFNYLVSSASPLTFFWDDLTLVEGEDVGEQPPVEAPEDETLYLFEDITNFGWLAWDCCGGSFATLVDEADRGQVVSFNKAINDSVLGFSSREDHGVPAGAELIDVDAWKATGTFSFDMKVTNGVEHSWKLKIEAPGSHIEVDLPEAPVLDTWQTYTFNLADLASVDQSQINLVMIFPAWGQGAGATYLIDNVKFTSLGNDTPEEPETPEEPSTPLSPPDMTNNLVPNGDFSLGNSNWNGDFTVNDGIANVVISGGEKRIEQQRISEGVVSPNTDYVLSFDIKGSAENGAIFNGNVQSFSEFGVSSTFVIDAFVPTSNWERKTYNFTSGPNVEWGLNILLGPVCGAVAGCASNVFIDNILVEER